MVTKALYLRDVLHSVNNYTDNYFEKSFLKLGNLLESHTANILSPNLNVPNQPTFIGLSQGKSRDGDILATGHDQIQISI
jgi:hypothetical protein